MLPLTEYYHTQNITTEYYHTRNITTEYYHTQSITTHRILPHTEYYHRKTKRYRNTRVRTLVYVCSWGLCPLVRAICATLCRESVSVDTVLMYCDML